MGLVLVCFSANLPSIIQPFMCATSWIYPPQPRTHLQQMKVSVKIPVAGIHGIKSWHIMWRKGIPSCIHIQYGRVEICLLFRLSNMFSKIFKASTNQKHTFARLTVHEYLEDHPRTRQVVSNPAFKSYLGHLQGVLGTYITMGQLPTYRSWGLILQVFHHFMRKKNKPWKVIFPSKQLREV